MPKIHTEVVKFCIYSGDPGCLGWPDWHWQDCIYEEHECQFCECGGHDVYGEMYHTDECPLSETEVELCESCNKGKSSVYPRPDLGNRALCAECARDRLREISPTNLVRVPAWLRAGAAR